MHYLVSVKTRKSPQYPKITGLWWHRTRKVTYQNDGIIPQMWGHLIFFVLATLFFFCSNFSIFLFRRTFLGCGALHIGHFLKLLKILFCMLGRSSWALHLLTCFDAVNQTGGIMSVTNMTSTRFSYNKVLVSYWIYSKHRNIRLWWLTYGYVWWTLF